MFLFRNEIVYRVFIKYLGKLGEVAGASYQDLYTKNVFISTSEMTIEVETHHCQSHQLTQ